MSAAVNGNDDDDIDPETEAVVGAYREDDAVVFYTETKPKQWIKIRNPIDVEDWA